MNRKIHHQLPTTRKPHLNHLCPIKKTKKFSRLNFVLSILLLFRQFVSRKISLFYMILEGFPVYICYVMAPINTHGNLGKVWWCDWKVWVRIQSRLEQLWESKNRIDIPLWDRGGSFSEIQKIRELNLWRAKNQSTNLGCKRNCPPWKRGNVLWILSIFFFID